MLLIIFLAVNNFCLYNLIIVPIVECISKLTTHKITLLTTRFRFSPPFGFRTAHFPHVQFLLRPKSICSWHFTNLSIVRHWKWAGLATPLCPPRFFITPWVVCVCVGGRKAGRRRIYDHSQHSWLTHGQWAGSRTSEHRLLERAAKSQGTGC